MSTRCGSFEWTQTPEIATSQCIVLFLFHSPEFWKSQEDAPQPESSVAVPPSSETTGEKSSVSEYFSCVSSLSKLVPANEDGKGNTQVRSEHGWEVQLSCSAQAILTLHLKAEKGFRAEALGLKPLQRDKKGSVPLRRGPVTQERWDSCGSGRAPRWCEHFITLFPLR